MRMAKSLCETCPVLLDCRDYAVDAGEQHGIWGGMTVKERRAVRMAKKKATSSQSPLPSE